MYPKIIPKLLTTTVKATNRNLHSPSHLFENLYLYVPNMFVSKITMYNYVFTFISLLNINNLKRRKLNLNFMRWDEYHMTKIMFNWEIDGYKNLELLNYTIDKYIQVCEDYTVKINKKHFFYNISDIFLSNYK